MRLQVCTHVRKQSANSLANLGTAVEFQIRREIHVKHITNPSIQQPAREVLRLDTSPGGGGVPSFLT